MTVSLDFTGLEAKRYTLDEQLGEGGFGTVYAAVNSNDEQVAIKVLDKEKNSTIPGRTGRIPLEKAIMMILSEPSVCVNVVQMLDWLDLSTSYIMVMERPIPSMDLQQYCESKGPLLPKSALKVFKQVVVACQFCFDRGVYHNDIKLDNILINTETFVVKLIDFGLAKKIETNERNDDILWLGKLLYALLHFPNVVTLHTDPHFRPVVSEACRQLILQCLDQNNLPTFMEILNHECFNE
ncbi:serine/threonine-protein kinase pim-1-like isoform X1, partial [Clarias magur]